ncbi:discoidin domain-containing protein [Kribbella sp. CA-293567]|uniref:discoidin domain-containing protein n=1 Tax=Kribbella sp. CA-293567 TaxID=3002436 RepID=UPI0022DE8783|nr:discoidin domain-containing protein [Kribbella sp. CA-293567]WBQ04961.1 discoidin domain-containing protein [Kribbella sp. CA-293567]
MRTTPGKWRLFAATVVGSLVLSAGPMFAAVGQHDRGVTAAAAVLAGPNLAAGKSASSTSSNQNYTASNVTDGNAGTYWESANNAFPQWVQVDLGSSVSTNQVVLKLPTSGWGARNQTLAVQGSTDGQNFNDLSASASRAFNPPSNAVTIDYGTSTVRYIRIWITANTGWPAGQLSELEVYGPATGDTQAPTAPGSLAFTEPAAGQIRLTWTASTDNVGVTGYDVYANGALRTSLAGSVLTYTDSQPASASISYFVRAKDAVGNQSPNSNTVTRGGSNGPGNNLALGKPITASGSVHTFVATNANDDNVQTYWEGNGSPATLTTQLGSNADLSSVVVRLNPDSSWGNRTQTFSVLGREQGATGFTTIAASASYNFSPASGNSVTIPVSARVADVRLNFTANTGAPAGQVAELQVMGVPAPNPDLTVSNVTWTPTSPVETDTITLSARVNNTGSAAAPATNVNFYLGTTKVGTAAVGALAAGASATVTAAIGSRDAGSYPLSAKVDEANTVIEQNDANNTGNSAGPLVVTPVASSDLIASAVSWSPGNPAAGNTVTFSVALKNQGSIASAAGAHGITLTLLNGSTVVRTLTASYSGAIAAGATTAPISLGTWTAANGRYSVRVVLADDANELPVKRTNNTSERPFFVGRGANMPYDHLEAEDASVGGGAVVLSPNRTVGNLAGEASGRRAVTLNSNGSFVEFTTRASTNTLVTRFSIPDSAGGGGINSTINVYVNGTFHKALPLTSKYAWLYGAEAGPGNSPGAGSPRHIYDEANIMLDGTFPAGTKIKLQKDPGNDTNYAIDFVNTEQVAPIANPGTGFLVPSGFSQQDVQNAIDTVRQSSTLQGVYLPAGTYPTASKFNVYGKAIKVVGAGPWYTRFVAPTTQTNTDVGFDSSSSANGSTFSGFSYFGNYDSRNDGPGKVFNFNGTSNMTIDNIWIEHQMCLYWGANTDNSTIKNSRIRDTFADGINMTNGSSGNTVSNNDARSTGDDSFALFNAVDGGGGEVRDNVFENLTSTLTWRAAGFAVYGGTNNVFRNLYVADTLVYSGITISSLDFGIPMNGFGATPPTRWENISVARAGGHFWNGQTFPGIWIFSASKVFQGIRLTDVDIVDPTYSGIMFQTNYVGSAPQFPVADTILTNVSISGARKSGDQFDAKSGFGIWANELPEPGQGPAVGSVTFNNLTLSNNAVDIRNTTSTFTINRN